MTMSQCHLIKYDKNNNQISKQEHILHSKRIILFQKNEHPNITGMLQKLTYYFTSQKI